MMPPVVWSAAHEEFSSQMPMQASAGLRELET